MTEKRNDVIQIRVSAEEKRAIQDFAAKAGMNTSDYLRRLAQVYRLVPRTPQAPDEQIAEAVNEWAKPIKAAVDLPKPAISPARARFFNS